MKRALSLVLSLILVLALLPASTALADSQAYGIAWRLPFEQHYNT